MTMAVGPRDVSAMMSLIRRARQYGAPKQGLGHDRRVAGLQHRLHVVPGNPAAPGQRAAGLIVGGLFHRCSDVRSSTKGCDANQREE